MANAAHRYSRSPHECSGNEISSLVKLGKSALKQNKEFMPSRQWTYLCQSYSPLCWKMADLINGNCLWSDNHRKFSISKVPVKAKIFSL